LPYYYKVKAYVHVDGSSCIMSVYLLFVIFLHVSFTYEIVVACVGSTGLELLGPQGFLSKSVF